MTCHYIDVWSDPEAGCIGWSEGVVVARKGHRCDECGAAIHPGDRYGRASGVIPGEGPQTWKRCIECVVLADRLQTQFKLCIPWGCLMPARDDLEPRQ